MTRLCILDCDGTLVDSQHEIIAAMQRAFADSGLAEPTDDAIRHIVGLSLRDAVLALLPPTATVAASDVAAAYVSALAEVRRPAGPMQPLFPGALEALAELEAGGWLLGIATGKSRAGLLVTLAEHDLTDRFVTLQTPDIAAGKPSPEMVLNAMAAIGAAPADTVMVGDTIYDVLMAKRAGVASIGVTWGYHPSTALTAAGAACIVASFADLVARLRLGPPTDVVPGMPRRRRR
ncbi:MAG: HAD-IA family hydrolase [Rhodospirillales bacterium]